MFTAAEADATKTTTDKTATWVLLIPDPVSESTIFQSLLFIFRVCDYFCFEVVVVSGFCLSIGEHLGRT
jgi:hypothetical protein